ncbi:type II toxin-antitoxin system RelE/ParE family toxin [Campylobacter hyointestinalis]|uniref:type II toxin-antitoxin system RelE/ParE family toxin n=1 Tax=Campylobacter hyointestinalis TaxID=198 RepID=UPI000CE47A87|nr:type II toxin-antitoxin system RelE/ParE family toxin [Campylobacter hyointestinalis]MDL2346181.1 type II toxin-antitoxin system RelE/ParE family toxin [Campylobacter hyointestinalis]MDL2347921.1 type II toxin-antitoxin system RelE/ParE family toxin [Campylobacter hyointestinalis]MDL2349664.1 type II toxin-antitoxin system RelE/ParE family toxin [Campylobacter hyointestinalis]MDM1025661.1 type II toxin-antitoxin system RelE/ParE family toxin [Campylobacter hyointestinalis]MDM1027670.1 type 
MVKFSERFKSELHIIFKFIAQDSKARARAFKNELLVKSKDLSNMPFRFRKSVTSDNDNIRDFIFKGYVMPFLIQDDTIIVLGIYKENQWES